MPPTAAAAWVVPCTVTTHAGGLDLLFSAADVGTQPFLLGQGTPPVEVISVNSDGTVELRALFHCPFEYVHDCHHSQTLMLRPGEERAVSLQCALEGPLPPGPLPGRYRTVRVEQRAAHVPKGLPVAALGRRLTFRREKPKSASVWDHVELRLEANAKTIDVEFILTLHNPTTQTVTLPLPTCNELHWFDHAFIAFRVGTAVMSFGAGPRTDVKSEHPHADVTLPAGATLTHAVALHQLTPHETLMSDLVRQLALARSFNVWAQLETAANAGVALVQSKPQKLRVP